MRQSKINLPEDFQPVQLNLFQATGTKDIEDLDPFPPILRDKEGFDRVASLATDALGLDFEFNTKTEKPSIAGISVRNLASAIPWDRETMRKTVAWCMQNGIKLVGHSVVGADKPVVEKALDIKTPLDMWEDSMIEHYLLNQDFCKAPGKAEDEGSYGYMNLWSMASMTTNAYNWKICRGKACEGPCPRCNVFEYCAIDSWAGLEGHYVMQEQMKKEGVPYKFYRELIELSEICDLMERQGLRIDIPYIEKLSKEMEEAKDKIFEYEIFGKTQIYTKFNPRSSDQIKEWFAKHNRVFKTTDINYIQKVLEKEGLQNGHGEFKEYVEFLEDNSENITSPTKELYDLWRFKSSGKGTDPWYSEEYRTGTYIHPRFISTGTSTGRLASSRPNGANIPSRGWAVTTDKNGNSYNRIKAAIVPRDESLDFIESDYRQMEFRGVLYLSGVDPNIAGEDAYNWLVQQDYEGFKKATAMWPGLDPEKFKDVRQVSKTMALAANYLEGIQIYQPEDMMKGTFKRQLLNGSIRLYKDWEYDGGIVGFDGANLALRFFGAKTEENRKKALDIQEDIYFKKFPMIRKWQQKMTEEIERTGRIKSPTGRFLRLYGTARDNAKIACAFLGQGTTGADHAQAVMLRYKREFNVIPDLVVHDSMLMPVDKGWSDKRVLEYMQIMTEETWRLPGFRCPIDVKRGPNYGMLRKLKI